MYIVIQTATKKIKLGQFVAKIQLFKETFV